MCYVINAFNWVWGDQYRNVGYSNKGQAIATFLWPLSSVNYGVDSSGRFPLGSTG